MASVKLDTAAWDKIKREVDAASRAHVKVGVLLANGGQATEEGSPISMVELAFIHEFGAPGAGIPERSFIRSTFAVHKKEELQTTVAKLAKALANGKLTSDRAMKLLGTWAAAAVKNTISAGLVRPRLEESEAGKRTIAAKGSSKTLVDTGRLINAISYEAVK